MVAALADTVEQICTAGDLAETAAQTLPCVSRLFSCSIISFSAFDLHTLDLLLDEHLGPGGNSHTRPRLERSRDLSASLEAGGQLLTIAEGPSREYFVLFEPQRTARLKNCELRIPFFKNSDILCILTLGKKDSGTDYSCEEIDALRVVVALLSGHEQRPAVNPASPPRRGIAAGLTSYQRPESYALLLGNSPQMRAIQEKIARIAPTDASVLIRGESGTGKELVARAIHQSSHQACRDMVIVNCAALPEQLAESELFGHERGAFTGALALKKGKFEFADTSTLFLDEIGDLSQAVQAKLLRFLQDGVFQRVGGHQNLRSQIRLLSATNKDLVTAITRGEFRSDLFYRINVVQIDLPPLREHPEDIPLLSEYYARHFAAKYQLPHSRLDPAIAAWLQTWSFPGNVRELINIVERMIILGNGPAALATLPDLSNSPLPITSSSHQRLDVLEREHIQAVLTETCNNKSAAARILGIARKTLREKMAKYNLQ
jgi:transcriptional regulator with GAF, ATPase, and Fis domain